VRRYFHLSYCLLFACLCIPASSNDRIQPAQDAPQPLAPGESAKRIRLPEGFRIDLVASEPVVKEPSGIAFDEHGRVFVCELHGYNIEGHIDTQELNKTGELDKTVRRIRWEFKGGKIAEEAAKQQYGVVKLLTDTDRDGVMDKAEVWADDLPPCYGIVAARGGVIVACAPHIMFFADRDGDGKPDVRETLFTGFKVNTIERGINNPIWGLDDWIYVGSGSGGGTITGPKLKGPFELGGSDFRIKADGSAIEHVNGSVGTFGLTMNDIGDRFPSSGGTPARYALPLPRHYLARNPHVAAPGSTQAAANYGHGYRISDPHPWRVKRGRDPAWVKFYGKRETNSNYFSGGCSTTFYGGRLFPDEYHGNLFYCEPSLNIVHRTVLTRDGAGYRARRAPGEQESEFLASTDQWFRPMNLRVGPDGALYIVDMYREIIEDYSAVPRFLQQQYGLNKGKEHGRIWRLSPKGKTPAAKDDLAKASTRELAQALADDNPWRRSTAQRMLIERGDRGARDPLVRLIRAEGTAPSGVIRALQTLRSLKSLESLDVLVALAHEDHGVRVHGLRLAGPWLDSDEALRSQLIRMNQDPDPRARLQLAMTLGESKDTWPVESLIDLAGKYGGDGWLAAAILSSSNNRNGGRLLLGLLGKIELSPGARALLKPLATTVGGRRDGEQMATALRLVSSLDTDLQKECLSGFVSSVSRGGAPAPESVDGWAALTRFLSSSDAQVRELAAKLSAKLPVAEGDRLAAMFAEAAETALEPGGELAKRRQALQILASAPFEALSPVASKLLDSRQPPSIQVSAIGALGTSVDERAAGLLLKGWPGFSPTSRSAVLRTIFARRNRLPALIGAIENGVVHPGDISGVQREQLKSIPDANLAARAGRLFKEFSTEAELTARIARYRGALNNKADPAKGKVVYQKNCIVCHKLGDQGNEVGPSLGSITGKPDESVLMDILDPNGKIEPEYKLYLISATGGKAYAGVLASESPTSVILKRVDGGADVILRKDIIKMTASELSLMPANLHTQINPQDATDLIAFLRMTFAGKPKSQ
jgi:putative membrane-bound dehydrogenase-like protein